MTLLFAYGSNMASSQLPEARFLGAARLDGYRLALTRRSIRWQAGVLDIVPAAGESVWGAVYDVTDESLAALDAREGSGFAYRRVDVELADGQRAIAYEVIDKEPQEVPCSREYAEVVIAAARERRLPEEWVRELAGITAR